MTERQFHTLLATAERVFLGHSLCTIGSTQFMTQLELYATPRLVVRWWTQVQVYSCMRITSQRLIKSLQSISNMTYVKRKNQTFKNKKTIQKRKMQSIVNIQIHTHQTKTSGLAPDYWLAPSLVLKLCHYYQVSMVLTWLQVRV